MAQIATHTRVDREHLLDLARTRHQHTLVTSRQDGRPPVLPVTGDPVGSGGCPPDRAPSA